VPGGAHEQGLEGRQRVERPVLRGQQRPPRVGRESRTAVPELTRRQPFGVEPLLPLPGYGTASLRLFPFGERQAEHPIEPEAHVHPGILAQDGGQLAIQVATANRETNEGVLLVGFDERREDSRGCLGRDAGFGAAVHDLDAMARRRERARHGRPHDPAADHQHVRSRHSSPVLR
jgi:hypothetical protein